MSPPLRIVGGRLATPAGELRVELHVAQGHIRHLGAVPTAASADAVVLDVEGVFVAPGFVDLQVNGGHGIDLTSDLTAAPEALWELARRLPEQGVTSFLPTIVSAPAAAVRAALAALRFGPRSPAPTADPIGLHVEGPFLAPTRRGTHDPAHLRLPDPALTVDWSRAAGVAMVTLAPELPGALAAVRELTARGVVVAIGHTDATYEQAIGAFDAGARAGTHLGNAMSGFAAREPGAIGALLADPRPVAGLIVDGVHLHPGAVAAVWHALGPARTALVTDAVAAAGTDIDTAVLGGRPITVRDGSVRDDEGRLAGSILTMDAALRGLVAATGADPVTAIRAASTTPASLLGQSDRGQLIEGARADLVLLSGDLEVVATFIGGRLAAHPRPDLLPLPERLGAQTST